MLVPETEIIVTKDGVEILRQTVRPGDYVIGREPGCDVTLDVDLVSRRHAQLTVNFDHALIEDLGSSNGTFVNGQPVTEATRLWPNQKIQIGAAAIELRRVKTVPPPDVSLAPQTAAVQRLLPEEFLREKKYDIGKVVAQGGMGAILDAKEATIERRVAMKVMLDGSSPDDLTRFISEAKITGQLEHPSIVPIYELSVDENGQVFYTMKMVRGITLRKVLELLASGVAETEKKYPLPALLTIFQKVCDALAFAHSKGVIHRDLKPENIMLDDFGVVLVMDWGFAKIVGKSGAQSSAEPRSVVRSVSTEDTGSMTMAGTIMGTPQYMSPEQARGEVETLDVRSDIFALGAILYHILNLRPPVSGKDAWAIVDKVAKGEVEPMDVGLVPGSLAAVVHKAMAFDKEQRYPSVDNLQRDLTAYQNGFATSAEKGFGKQILLAIKRHKAVAISIAAALVILTTVITGFTIKVVGERNRAERALGDLRKAAPTLSAQARSLVAQRKLDEAIEKLDFALTIDASNADYARQRADYLQAALRLNEAAAAYRHVLALRPSDQAALENLKLCEKLTTAGSEPDALSLRELYDALRAQRRDLEAVPLGDQLGVGSAAIEAIKAALGDWMELPGWKANKYRIDLGIGGEITLNLSDLPIQSLDRLAVLAGKPITSLRIIKTGVADLTPIAGFPLTHLAISDTPVADLTPVARMPLVMLLASKSAIQSLEPLRGKPLRELDINYCRIQSYEPLAGMPLQSLTMSGANLADLEVLRGMPLKRLTIGNAKFSSLEPLRGMPLEWLAIFANPRITSLAPLHGMLLRELDVSGSSGFTDAALLVEIPTLTGLAIGKVPGLEALRGHPNLRIIGYAYDKRKPVAKFWAEYDAQQAAGKK